MTGFNDSFGDVISRLEKENAALREEIEELNISRNELDALTKQWYELAENNGKKLVESEAENAALKARAEKAEAKLSELHAFLEEDIYSVAPGLREAGLEHFGGYFTNWDTVIDHCAIILDKDIYYAEDPIELFYRIRDRLDEREAELARVQERAEKAEADLKSAMEEIERQSFARHGLEQENSALKRQVQGYLDNWREDWGGRTAADLAAEMDNLRKENAALKQVMCGDKDAVLITFATYQECENRMAKLREENAALRAMLKRLEWMDEPELNEPYCRICHNLRKHKSDCALAALLKGEDDENPAKTV